MDRELLLEIGVEELPAAWLPGLTKQLSEKLQARLKEMRLTPDVAIESFSTPRRLTARIGRMPERQEDLDETVTGPPVSAAVNAAGEPTPAALGFAKKQGVAFAALERVKTEKGEYLAARKHHRGLSTVDALPELLASLLRDLAFPKHMHWDAMLEDGKGELVFGRPIRWLLYLYGGRVVPFTIGRTPKAAGAQVQDVTSGALTYGHRYLATSGRAGRSIKVRTFDEYRARLPEHFVILEHSERRNRIARELEAKARKLGGRVHLRDQAGLVDEVADLVEFPGVVAGFFERGFLALPHEVLTTTLVHHQHYFPVLTDGGELKEAFLAVVNTQPQDERLIAKNAERVVTARLRDAKFFWDADRQTKLEDRLQRLHTIVFHKKLGSYRDKAERIEKLARTIAADVFGLGGEQAQHAGVAARLAKTDLVTDMVFEFPELQGQMGGIYAREEGQPEPVWKAIYYQYLPVGVEAEAPPSRAQLGSAAASWAALSLADKLDTLVGMLQYEKVTGSRDPFGLRRAGHGIARILVDLEELTGVTTRPALRPVVDAARSAYQFEPLDDSGRFLIWGFLADRLRHLMTQRGLEFEEIQAVTGNLDAVADVSWRDLLDRAVALREVRLTPTFAPVAEAYKRAANIVEEAWGSAARDKWNLSRNLLIEPAEVALAAALERVGARIRENLAARNPAKALQAIASLQPDLERFFTEVRVNVDDEALREARLSLLAEVRDRIYELGDISMMSVKK
jgi:glycyl-tRNA synthetase beta chain